MENLYNSNHLSATVKFAVEASVYTSQFKRYPTVENQNSLVEAQKKLHKSLIELRKYSEEITNRTLSLQQESFANSLVLKEQAVLVKEPNQIEQTD
jgi:hypothetical protein